MIQHKNVLKIILVLLFCSFVFSSCQDETNSVLDYSTDNCSLRDAISRLDTDVRDANHRKKLLRSLSSNVALLDLDNIEIKWRQSNHVILGDSVVFIWAPFDARCNSVLVSNDIDSVVANRLNHRLSYTVLVRYENVLEPDKSISLFAHFVPSVEYLSSGLPIYGSGKLVPERFDGQLHLYDLNGNLKAIQQYINGVPYELVTDLRSVVSICFTQVTEAYAGVEPHLVFKGYTYKTRCEDISMSDDFSSRNIYDAVDNIRFDYSGGGGGGGVNLPQEPKTPMKMNPCGEAKRLMERSEISSKIAELIAHRKSQRGKASQNELGYVELSDGKFESGIIERKGHSVNFDLVLGAKKGFIHSHTSDYINTWGDTIKTIQTFSHTDVEYFMGMLAKAQNNKIPPEELYGMVVTDVGTFILRYGGDASTLAKDVGTLSWNKGTATFGKSKRKTAKYLEGRYKEYTEDVANSSDLLLALNNYIAEIYGNCSVVIQHISPDGLNVQTIEVVESIEKAQSNIIIKC